MTKFHSNFMQEVPAAVEEVDPFDEMMSALDWYFHVTSCRNHSNAERLEAFREAREAFAAFAGDLRDDEAFDELATAPSTRTVN